MRPDIYPNPADEFIRIDNRTLTIKLYDASGDEVPVVVTPRSDGQYMQVGHLPEGMYFIRTNDHENVAMQKVLVRHNP
ncbi:T9SS type A sorting domain-containing protein [Chryseolinea soli]|uniref:T9SS C-terminal target domain-containing protein n=1 Tax=Chryseolinea soli TaxID=2321403 RepID=A0A385SXA4_9BACT|nr:T9SS type A sorting domain-containing protein [Chryseolinea soli]AYB34645.1 T9SS C-terminal target domain-containing protein [Chryseolinea soli]